MEVSSNTGTPCPRRNLHAVCYNPLYFENADLERCGAGQGCLTDAASAVRFFGTIPILPYLATDMPPASCIRALPDCPACHRFGLTPYHRPFNPQAAAVQAAAVVGLIFLVP